MGLRATFDPVGKLITLTEMPISNKSSLDVAADLYSAAKLDWKNDLNLNKFRFPFTSIGGQDLGNNILAGSYYFLDNATGWRLKPYESDHILTVAGNLFGNDPNSPLFVPTNGGHTVLVNMVTSNLTQQVVSGNDGLNESELHTALNNYPGKDDWKADPQDVADKVWSTPLA